MKTYAAALILVVGLVTLLASCEKKTETFDTPELSAYYPLQVGKRYIYRLDSTLPAAFGTSLIVKSYLAKDSIESTFTDNQGRLSYRIFRFTRDTAATRPWQFAATYVATVADKQIEYIDNNLRFIKLHQPIKEGFKWKAHSFIDTYSSQYIHLADWEYEYRSMGEPYTIFNKTYPNTVTVFQHDETNPAIPFSPNLTYQSHASGVEVYAEGVGLIYKDFLHWQWQGVNKAYDDNSFGVRLRLISND